MFKLSFEQISVKSFLYYYQKVVNISSKIIHFSKSSYINIMYICNQIVFVNFRQLNMWKLN